MRIFKFIILMVMTCQLFAEENTKEVKNKSLLNVFEDRAIEMRKSIEQLNFGTKAVDKFSNNEIAIANIPIRDPFNLSEKLKSQGPSGAVRPTTFLPDASQQLVPKLKLKGVITPGPNSPNELVALLQVNDKEVYMVKVGDEVSFDSSQPKSAIKIQSINRLSVTVNVGNLGNVLVVR